MKDDYAPLFLGADVLSKCGSYPSKNLGRIHSKFALCGLACKVVFPSGCRIKGLRGTGDNFWFYSIQGLFRVAFEYYSREEQKDLLEKLQEVWISRIEDSQLEQSIVIDDRKDYQEISKFLIMGSELQSNLLKMNTKHTPTYLLSESLPENQLVEHSSALAVVTSGEQNHCIPKILAAVNAVDQDEPDNKDVGECQDEQRLIDSSEWIDKESRPEETCMNIHKLSKTHEVRNNEPDASSDDLQDTTQAEFNESEISQRYQKKLEQMLLQVFYHYQNETSLDIILSYLEAFMSLCIQEKDNIVKEQSTAFPIKLIKDYLELKELEIATYQDHELAIHVLSSWVGEKFNVFRDIIRKNVDNFKQEHINSISDLPHAEEIIKQIYPSAMYSLLYLWMQGPAGNQLLNSQAASQVKSSSTVCLLALELLNNLPITGVGHYVYSLLQTT